MKNFLILFLIIMSFSTYSNAAQVCVVDVDKVVFESKAGRFLSAKLQEKILNFQNKFRQKEHALEQEKKSLQHKRDSLKKDVFEKLKKDFESTVMEFQKQTQKDRAEIENVKAKGLEQIEKVVKVIINDLSKKMEFDLVLPLSVVLFNNSNIDITKLIIDKLDAKLQKVEIN